MNRSICEIFIRAQGFTSQKPSSYSSQ